MRRHEGGPRRSQSVDALLRRTRLLAIVALLALAGGIVSDVVGGSFWARHALLAGLTASVIIVMLTEELDRSTLELALRIVPLEWWQARLGATAPPERRPAAGPASQAQATRREPR